MHNVKVGVGQEAGAQGGPPLPPTNLPETDVSYLAFLLGALEGHWDPILYL